MLVVKKSINQIIKRTLVLQTLVDRGYEEKNIKDNINVEKIKEIRNVVTNWVNKENISEWMSTKEKMIFLKDLNTLTLEEMGESTWLVECLSPLLWVIGITDEMQDFSKFMEDKYYPNLFFAKDNPVDKVKQSLNIENELNVSSQDIEKYYFAYLLIYWRCKVKLGGYKKKINIRELFDKYDGFKEALDILPIYKNGDLILIYQLVFSELNKKETSIIFQMIYNRLRSLYWLLFDIEWEEINGETFNTILEKYNINHNQ
jgi:Domain of unknown function (DUF4272)